LGYGVLFLVAGVTLYHTSKSMHLLGFYILGVFLIALTIEVILRLVTKRVIKNNVRLNNK